MVFGVKCTKDSIHVAALAGSVKEPISSEDRLKITIRASKAQKIRGGILIDMKKEFDELLEKYTPNCVCIKRAGNSPGRVSTKSQTLKGEVEGIIHMSCFQNDICVEELLNNQIKPRLGLNSGKSKDLHSEVNTKFSGIKFNDEQRDAILAGWAILDE